MDNKKDKNAWMKQAKEQKQKETLAGKKEIYKDQTKDAQKSKDIYKKEAFTKSSQEQKQKEHLLGKKQDLTKDMRKQDSFKSSREQQQKETLAGKKDLAKDMTKNMKDSSFRSSREQQQKMSRDRREEDRDSEEKS